MVDFVLVLVVISMPRFFGLLPLHLFGCHTLCYLQ
jgi:hypothetical protein